MFKAFRIFVLLCILAFVALGTWLAQVRSTDWNNTLWITVYPINADGEAATDRYIASLSDDSFTAIETFFEREVARYGVDLSEAVRVELGRTVNEQPPRLPDDANVLSIMLWSLKMRWWAGSVTGGGDDIAPDVRMFVRFHQPDTHLPLENSVGIQKGMFGIVNAYAGRRYQARNNFVIAHEFLHTIGASDKYDYSNNQPRVPEGLGEPDKTPLYPQRYAELMGGRIALTATSAEIPRGLRSVLIGTATAEEIGLID